MEDMLALMIGFALSQSAEDINSKIFELVKDWRDGKQVQTDTGIPEFSVKASTRAIIMTTSAYFHRSPASNEVLRYPTLKSQNDLCKTLVERAHRLMPSSKEEIRDSASGRSIALYAMVDGYLSNSDTVSFGVDFRSGMISSVTSFKIESQKYLRVGDHLSEGRIKSICKGHGVTQYSVIQYWRPYNQVFPNKASANHVSDWALASIVTFHEDNKDNTMLINDLEEVQESVNMLSWFDPYLRQTLGGTKLKPPI